ncbi:hypothetical protein B0H11DRAFT_1901172 [Mycena galericulata]|nr:hypothetical protein B0H11DRAFT_1901172 [Mycena galericulata]
MQWVPSGRIQVAASRGETSSSSGFARVKLQRVPSRRAQAAKPQRVCMHRDGLAWNPAYGSTGLEPGRFGHNHSTVGSVGSDSHLCKILTGGEEYDAVEPNLALPSESFDC